MKYDDILYKIGEFGIYQKCIFLLVSTCTLFAPMNVVTQVFTAGETDHWCDVQVWNNCTACQGSELQCEALRQNLSIPINEEGVLDQCNQYDIETVDDCSEVLSQGVWNASNDIIPCDNGWVYDKSQYDSTIISDFDLVCHKQSFPGIAQTVYFSGILVGSVSYGTLSDKLGRRFALFAATIGTGVFGILVTSSNSFLMYTVMRFFLAACAHSTFLMGFVLVSEMVGPSKRVFTGIFIEFFFAFGIMFLAILAYFIRKWRVLQLVTTLPGIMTLLLLPLIPESPRWLISKGRYEEARVIIRRTARINGVELTDQYLEQMEEHDLLFRLSSMRWRTCNLLYNWFVQSLLYYGLIFYTGSLGVNIYLGFLISGAVEIIGYTSSIFLIEAIGRKLSLSGLLLLVGISCLLVMFTHGVVKFVIGMIGKSAISATFGIIFVFTAELFPTPLRGVMLGLCSMTSRIGGMVCPLIFILAHRWPLLPLSLFTVASIVAAAITLLLPETKGVPLPETILEAEALSYRGRRAPLPTTSDEELGLK
ncbi:organic cation transporter protein-like isoform X2 [Apostichopus japonicus]|uniref:organic cation transporter protein-like isoform X2 n=1 Tax=Stichopus japonicus TaxID=307972 RepID=UPI003AB813F2